MQFIIYGLIVMDKIINLYVYNNTNLFPEFEIALLAAACSFKISSLRSPGFSLRSKNPQTLRIISIQSNLFSLRSSDSSFRMSKSKRLENI